MLPEPAGAPRDLYASRNFIVVHLDMVDAVGFDAALLFQRIAWRCEDRDGWTATLEDLQTETRLTAHRLRQAITVLREAGWVSSERSGRFDPTLTWRPVWAGQPVVQESCVTSPGVADPLVVQESCTTSVTQDQGETEGLIDQPALVAVDDLDADFAAFWDEYPRRVGKGQALKAYRAARKHADAATILAGLLAQLPTLQARERAYIPHASTWLNGQRWLDDVGDLVAAAPTGRRNHTLDALVAGQSSAQIIDAAFGEAGRQMLGGRG